MKLTDKQRRSLLRRKKENDRILDHKPEMGWLALKIENNTINLLLQLDRLEKDSKDEVLHSASA